MAEDWDAVATAIDDRLRELPLTVRELARRARVGESTVRELRYNSTQRQRHPGTLRSVSRALEWSEDHLAAVLSGETRSAEHAIRSNRPALESLHVRLDHIEAMLRRLLLHVGAEVPPPADVRDDDR